MKLEKRFYVESNRLHYIEGNREFPLSDGRLNAADCVKAFAAGGSLPADLSRLLLLELPWTLVGCDESSYNEEFLASFRDFLKALEEKGGYAAIVPVADRQPAAGEGEDFIASFKHCARRIKDCASVVGFVVPAGVPGVEAAPFMEELSAKHGHYVFFSGDSSLLGNPELVGLPA
ncbi:MAG: hypothetical protein K6G18_14335 [Treponema sp.]|nr:hypothetical protein [Treponema sp.]